MCKNVLCPLPEKLSLPCGHRFAVRNQYCGTRQRIFCRAWSRGITAKPICTAKHKKSARQINTHGKTYRKHTAHLRHSAKKLCRVFFYQPRQRIWPGFAAVPRYFAGKYFYSRGLFPRGKKIRGKTFAVHEEAAHGTSSLCRVASLQAHGTSSLCRVPRENHTAKHVFPPLFYFCRFRRLSLFHFLLRLIIHSFTWINYVFR